MKTRIFAVVGSKKSGKTTAMEALTRELTRRGHRVATVKHISEEGFSFDAQGKDTWRFAQAGAKTIVAVSPYETVTVQKRAANSVSLREILQKCKDDDVILMEGFKRSVARNRRIYKIVTVKSADEAHEAVSNFWPILAFVGPFSTENLDPKVPYVDAMKDPEKLAYIVENALDKKI